MSKAAREAQILCVTKKPGEKAKIEPLFPNELKAFQEFVGGYIETVTFATDACVICNEEGMINGLPYNCSFCGADFFGPIMVVGIKRDEFASVKGIAVARLLHELNKE